MMMMVYYAPNISGLAPDRQFYFYGPRGDLTDHNILSNIIYSVRNCNHLIQISLEIVVIGIIGNKSALLQIMAWCLQEASHSLNQGWPRLITPNGVIRPPRVRIYMLDETFYFVVLKCIPHDPVDNMSSPFQVIGLGRTGATKYYDLSWLSPMTYVCVPGLE